MGLARLVALIACGAALAWPTSGRAGDPFTIVHVPDPQHYSENDVDILIFEAQLQWIVDNVATENIVFAAVVGDMVEQSPLLEQWTRSAGAVDILDGDLVANPDGELPYSVVPGNHDYDVFEVKGPATEYLVHFGPSRFAGRSWFVGASPNSLNTAQRFVAGDQTYLSLALEWLPSDDAIEWAQGVMSENPDLPTIVSTHEHLRLGTQAPYSSTGETDDSGGDNDGESLFRKLVEPFPQVFLVLAGHQYGDGRREETTALGQQVHQILANYQEDPNAGNGWMQLLELRPDSSEIEFETFSPTYVPGVTTGPDRSQSPDSNFTLSFDLNQHVTDLESTTTLRFREGQDFGFGAYAGTVDTFIGSGGDAPPDQSQADADTLVVDGNGDDEQALVRFEGIVGSAPGQIPPGTSIDRAILTLTTESASAQSGSGASFHRMIVSWDEDATWNELVGGIDLGVDANPTVDGNSAGLVGSRGTDSIDVTPGVQAWVDGEANLGWALLNNATDGWRFRSSEWGTLAERPMLTVSFVPSSEVPALSLRAIGVVSALLLGAGLVSGRLRKG